MDSWEEWHSDDMEAFPKLKDLQLIDCYKLVGSLPCQLLSLETLGIYRCPLFVSCNPRSPKLKNSEISASQNAVWQGQDFPPSLEKLVISGGRMLESMLEALSRNLQIQDISISDCSNMSLQTIDFPVSLKRLLIEKCENINFVLSSTTDSLQDLQLISIVKCKFLKLSSGDMESLVPNLKELHIDRCHDMEAFPQGILVSSLTALHVRFSWKLVSCHAQWQLPRITYLHIRGDFDIKCFPEAGSLPATLTTLELHEFENLETLNCRELQHLTSLQDLKIRYCPNLKEMSGKLPNSVKLHIWECPLLEERLHNKDEEIMAILADISFLSLNPDPLQ